jgi:aminocarboxymuconate-semialdehyde decarboxylase
VKVDVHAHVLPPEIMGKAGPYGPERLEGGMRVGAYVARGGSKLDERALASIGDPAKRVEDLDRLGVDHMIVTTSPLLYLYWAEPEIAVGFNRAQNDALAAYASAAPGRLSFAGTLPMQVPEAALDELDHLEALGAVGVNVGANELGPYELDSPELWPLYERIEAARLPLVVHPHPLSMADGAPDAYNLNWVVGYNYQETMAFARLTLGGVFDDFPGLKVHLTHGGGAVPFQFGRLVAAQESQAGVRAQRPIADYLDNFFFDVLVHDLPARRFLYEFMGADRLVVGSNYGGWDAADGFGMLDELDLPAPEAEKVAAGNSIELFGLDVA